MKNHHINSNRKNFFEGWYFKHSAKDFSIAFIPGINIKNGQRKSFIQIITPYASYNVDYSMDEFYAHDKNLFIRIGKNIFSFFGLFIDIQNENIHIKGDITYGQFTPIRYDIMGPFAISPYWECNHGIISMKHPISGTIKLNGHEYCLNNGKGYIEKDWGTSFPKSYTWLQCNDFKERDDVAVMVSAAHIPFTLFDFEGLIAIIMLGNKEYRFATYNGGKVRHAENAITVNRGNLCLKIKVQDGTGHPLKAPGSGAMDRIIHEDMDRTGIVQFYKNRQMLFSGESDSICFESVMEHQ